MTPAQERRTGELPAARRTAARTASRTGSLASRTVLRLQAGAGNAAVSRLLSAPSRAVVQRLDPGGACPPPAVAPAPPAPRQDPAFAAVLGQVGAATRATSAHPPARTQAKAAQDAAKPPADDKEAQAKAAQAGDMAAAEPVGFDRAAFIAAVDQAIAAQAPKSLEEADSFASSGRADAIKGEVMGKVSKGKDDSARPLAETAAATPDTGKAVEKPVTPLPATPTPGAPPGVDAAAAMPKKAPAEQTELGAPACETDSAMAQAGVSEQQLASSNEPEFQGALAAKKEGEAHSATAPGQVRQAEAATQAGAQAAAGASGAAATTAMTGARGRALAGVAGHQGASRTADEARRAQVSGQVKAIFDRTKTEVDAILGGLDGRVSAEFTAGEAEAKSAFTREHQTRMDAYKDDRYSGVLGWGRWLKDKVRSPPPEVNRIYAQARTVYETKMRAVIGRVADLVGAELTRAKARVAQGRAEISTYAAGLPKDLQRVGNRAASDIGDQFDTLESSVDEKGQALAEDLANKYVEARTAVDAEITALQEANKGLWDRAKDAVGGAIETILKLKDMLVGVLARAAGAVEKIIKDPIGFLGNFVSAVKTGVMNFGSNILEHLKEGLKGWLFGALAEAGIEIPETFDLKGIIQLILSLLGLTWNAIRARILRFVPEPVMALIEKSVDFVQAIMSEGVVGLWKWVAGKLGDLKELVLGKIEDFVVTKVITAGITWLISLLNPAAAFIKACKMIYDAVMWFVDNAARLKQFVDSILDSVESIASGGVGAVAGYIEKTLAEAVPMVISGLASLLGLGGVAEKIKGILETVQKPVMKVVDTLIGTAVTFGKKLLGKVRGKGKGKGKGKGEGAVDPDSAKHEQIADEVKGALEAPPAPDATGGGEFAESKQSQARSLEQRYAPSLRAGVGIRVLFEPPKTSEKGEELGFRVVIAPNTTTRPGRATSAGGGKKRGDHIFAHGLSQDLGNLRTLAVTKLGNSRAGRTVADGLAAALTQLSGDIFTATIDKGASPAEGDAHSQKFGRVSERFYVVMTSFLTALELQQNENVGPGTAQAHDGFIREAAQLVGLRLGAWIDAALDPEAAAAVPDERAAIQQGQQALLRVKGTIEALLRSF